MEAIGVLRDEKAVEYVIAALKDDDRFVRQEAAMALAKIGGVRALESMTQALAEEKNEFVRDFIQKAIGRLQPE